MRMCISFQPVLVHQAVAVENLSSCVAIGRCKELKSEHSSRDFLVLLVSSSYEAVKDLSVLEEQQE